MSPRKNISISLSPELHAVAERTLPSVQYGNFNRVVRAGLRLLDEREMRFRAYRDTQDASWQTAIGSPMFYPRVERSGQEMLLVADHAIVLGTR